MSDFRPGVERKYLIPCCTIATGNNYNGITWFSLEFSGAGGIPRESLCF